MLLSRYLLWYYNTIFTGGYPPPATSTGYPPAPLAGYGGPSPPGPTPYQSGSSYPGYQATGGPEYVSITTIHIIRHKMKEYLTTMYHEIFMEECFYKYSLFVKIKCDN